MDDEWRLTAELDGGPDEIERLVSTLSARLPEEARLTRDGRTVRVYSNGEADAARIEAVALALLERTGLGYELWHDRWDEEATEWEEIAPDLPPGEEPPDLSDLAPPTRAEAGAPELHAGEPGELGFPGAVTSLQAARVLVLLTFPDKDAGAELRARLVESGIPLVSRRRGFGVPAADDADAARLAAALRAQAPPGTSIDTTVVHGRRRGG